MPSPSPLSGRLQLSLYHQKMEYHHRCLTRLHAEQKNLGQRLKGGADAAQEGAIIQQLMELQDLHYMQQQRQSLSIYFYSKRLHLQVCTMLREGSTPPPPLPSNTSAVLRHEVLLRMPE